MYVLLAIAVGDASKSVPYSSLSSSNVTVSGQLYHLKRPSIMTIQELQYVLRNIESLKFVSKCYYIYDTF